MSWFSPSRGAMRLLAVLFAFALVVTLASPRAAASGVVAWGSNSSGQTNVPAGLTNAIAVAGGNGHSLALRADGTVVTWGGGTATNVPAGLSNVIAIAAGSSHSIALRASGTVVAWGASTAGQTNVPPGLSGVIAIAAGSGFSLALRNDGSVVAWGANQFGQTNVPAGLTDVIGIAAGINHSMALRANGTVIAWGQNQAGQTSVPPDLTNVVAIAGGRSHSVALRRDATVVAWGTNTLNQTTVPADLNNVVSIASVNDHTLARRADGTVVAWGLNTLGQTNVPVGLANVQGIAAGHAHSLAITGLPPALRITGVGGADVYAGQLATLRVTALGEGLTYQWQRGGTNLPSATNASLLFPNVQLADAGFYRCAVIDASTTILSDEVLLTVTTLKIFQYPQSFISQAWSNVTFRVVAGGAELTYQWRRNGTNLSDDARFRGTKSPVLNISQAHPLDDGNYSVVVTNPYSTVVSSNASLKVLPVMVWVHYQFLPSAWVYSRIPKVPVDIGEVKSIAAGPSDAFAIRTDHSMVVWGGPSKVWTNLLGGSNILMGVDQVYPFSGLSPSSFFVIRTNRTIAAGAYYSSDTNEITANDLIETTRVPEYLTNIVSMSLNNGNYRTASTEDGKLAAVWGWGCYGPLTNSWPDYGRVAQVSAGALLMEDGIILPLKNCEFDIASSSPDFSFEDDPSERLPGSSPNDIVAVHRGGQYGIALRDNGTLMVWGNTNYTRVPAGLSNLVAISITGNLDLALRQDGTVVSWHSGIAQPPAPFPASAHDVVGISADSSYSLALLGNGSPALTIQPWNRTVIENENFALKAMAVGRGELTYQWQHFGTNVTGGTNRHLSFINAQPEHNGEYRLIVANSLGYATSKVARVRVLLRPRVEPLPGTAFAAVGSDLALTVNATGTGPLRYQWRRNGENIPGATNATFMLTNAQITDGGSYTVVVANEVGIVVSSPILVIIEVAQQPAGDDFANRTLVTGVTNAVGGTNRWATREVGEPLHAGKYGSNSVWYRWVAPVSGIATFRTVGSTFDTLLGIYTGTNVVELTAVAQDEDRGGFFTSELRFNAEQGTDYAIAIDGFFGQQGTFILTWEVETTAQSLPVVTTQPRSQTVRAGAGVLLQVAASGAGLTYQWHFNGTRIAGATGTALAVNNVRPPDVGFYTVAITNSAGRGIESLPAAIEIGPVSGVQGQDKLENLFGDTPPAGGIVAAALPSTFISVSAGTVDYQITSTRDATSQSWEPNHCGVIGGASKWFEFHATDDATVAIDTRGSTFDTVLAVYRKVGVLHLAQNRIDCSTDWQPGANWSRVSFQAQRNASYYVVVDGANVNDLTGRAQLNWAMGQLPVIATAPQYDFVRPGQRWRLSAGATNAVPPPTYRWYHNNKLILGATNDWFELASLQLTNAGFYSVAVSNALGEARQLIAQLSVPTLTSELRTADGTYQLTLAPVDQPGMTMLLESSTNLVDWTPVQTHTNTTSSVTLTLPLNSAQRFFRTRPVE